MTPSDQARIKALEDRVAKVEAELAAAANLLQILGDRIVVTNKQLRALQRQVNPEPFGQVGHA